jgi:hypothetical protein
MIALFNLLFYTLRADYSPACLVALHDFKGLRHLNGSAVTAVRLPLHPPPSGTWSVTDGFWLELLAVRLEPFVDVTNILLAAIFVAVFCFVVTFSQSIAVYVLHVNGSLTFLAHVSSPVVLRV